MQWFSGRYLMTLGYPTQQINGPRSSSMEAFLRFLGLRVQGEEFLELLETQSYSRSWQKKAIESYHELHEE
jgi:hypothetical protein